MIRWKTYWRCEWISWQTKQLEEIKNIQGYLINHEYFNNLNGDEDITQMGIMAGMGMRTGRICTSPYSSPYSYPYPYPYSLNAAIPKNGDKFKQYPQRQVYLPSLVM